jgi:hypothetical protein
MNLTIYSSRSQAHVSPDATLIRADANGVERVSPNTEQIYKPNLTQHPNLEGPLENPRETQPPSLAESNATGTSKP